MEAAEVMGIRIILPPFSLTIGTIAFLPSLYRSSALVLVDRQQCPRRSSARPSPVDWRRGCRLISQEVFSRARLDGIITRFHLYEDLKKRVAAEEVIGAHALVHQLEYRGVDRAGQRGTIAFAVSFRARIRRRAQVTNTLASFFIEENLKCARAPGAAGTPSSSRRSSPRSRPSSTRRRKSGQPVQEAEPGDLPHQAAREPRHDRARSAFRRLQSSCSAPGAPARQPRIDEHWPTARCVGPAGQHDRRGERRGAVRCRRSVAAELLPARASRRGLRVDVRSRSIMPRFTAPAAAGPPGSAS